MGAIVRGEILQCTGSQGICICLHVSVAHGVHGCSCFAAVDTKLVDMRYEGKRHYPLNGWTGGESPLGHSMHVLCTSVPAYTWHQFSIYLYINMLFMLVPAHSATSTKWYDQQMCICNCLHKYQHQVAHNMMVRVGGSSIGSSLFVCQFQPPALICPANEFDIHLYINMFFMLVPAPSAI